MTDIILSIHPKWAEKIYSGEKTVEVRKSSPDSTKTIIHGKKIYLYETKPVQKITGCVYLEHIKRVGEEIPWSAVPKVCSLINRSCLSEEELEKYTKGKGYMFWKLKDPQKFDTPQDIKGSVPQSWRYLKEGERYD
jgi:predicted transcriptional regulator